jgi:hypothetical protein
MIIGRDFGWSCIWDKGADTTVYTLNADGSKTMWKGPRVDAHVIYMEGNEVEIAAWLDQARSQHSELYKATGWHLTYHFTGNRDRPHAYHATLAWYDTEEWLTQLQSYDEEMGTELAPWYLEKSGPLMDIGVVFLHWHKQLMLQEQRREREEAVVMALEAKAHAEITAIEDERAFADINHYMAEGHA